MSVPARRLPTPPPGRKPAQSPAPARRKAPGPRTQPRPAGRHSRSHRVAPTGFLLLAVVMAVLAILSFLSLNALLAQNQFRIDRLGSRIETLSERNGELQREAAHLSAPGRVAAWARRSDMRLPDDPHILHVGDAGSDDPVGAGTPGDGISNLGGWSVGGHLAGSIDAEELAVKSALEGVR